MKPVAVARNMTHEHFVIQFDGHAKSVYRRLAEALKAALRLKDQFPDHNVKVRAIPASNSLGRYLGVVTW
jgi:hypothetical protein